MIFDTQITLRLFSYPIVNGQTTEKLERETTVWAARKSVNRAEYYQAAQAGKRTDAIFRMHSANTAASSRSSADPTYLTSSAATARRRKR